MKSKKRCGRTTFSLIYPAGLNVTTAECGILHSTSWGLRESADRGGLLGWLC